MALFSIGFLVVVYICHEQWVEILIVMSKYTVRLCVRIDVV